jgi:hypothetical protein
MTCDASYFHYDAETVIHENGKEIARKTWSEEIPRDHI